MANNIVFFVVAVFLAQGAFAEPTEERNLLTDFFTKLSDNTFSIKNLQDVTDCFTVQRQSFTNMVNYLQVMTNLVANKIETGVGSKQYAGLMDTISNSFKKLNDTVWTHVLRGDFQKALEGAHDIAFIVNGAADGLMKKLRKNSRKVFQEAISEFDKIKEYSTGRSTFMSSRVKECITNGGPYRQST